MKAAGFAAPLLATTLLAASVVTPGPAGAQVPPSPCLDTLSALEPPPNLLFAPDTVGALRSMAQDAAAFARIGNETACRTRFLQIRSILGDHVPDASAWQDHLGRLQAARPWQPAFDTVPEEELDDYEVWSPTGDWLGEAEGVVPPLDGDGGHLLVSRSGWFGLLRGVVAVPAELVLLAADGSSFVVPVTAETFEQAPALDDDDDFAASRDWRVPTGGFWREAVPG